MIILLNGKEFDGKVLANVTTDPKISVEELLFNRPEEVEITTDFWLEPTNGEPFKLRDGDTLKFVSTPISFAEDQEA